jgi:hypothetical protein
MNCELFRENVSDMLVEGVDPSSSADVTAHLDACPECARYLKEMRRTFTALQPAEQITASHGFRENVMNRITQMDTQTPRRAASRRTRSFYRRLVVVAACVLGLLLITPLFKLSSVETAAYAIEQTIKANLGLRSIHIKSEPSTNGSVSDIWAEFDENGGLAHLRMSFPDTQDGPKEVAWQKDVAEVWFKGKNADLLTSAPDMLAQTRMTMEAFDPRLMMEGLQKGQAAGKLEMKTQEPTAKDGPITLNVTMKGRSDIEDVYQVDPQSKLVLKRDRYRMKDGGKEWLGCLTYLDYNKPIDPQVFKLNPPADVIRVDQTMGGIGLPKGNLSDNEIAAKVAREYFEALIAEDYDKAGKLVGGMPGSVLRQRMGETGKYTRIISIGEPRPHPRPETGGMQVPCKVEVETSGTKTIIDSNPGVRPLENDSSRWNIFGGV